MASTLLIVNPLASRVSEARVEQVARAIGASEIARTERRGHGTELARQAAGNVDAIVVFAGDGGFNEVLNGVTGDVPVGFVPGGGSSVLPRALGLPRDPVGAALHVADALAAGRTRRISLGRVNGRRFAFAAGVGLDAEIVRRVDERRRHRPDGRRPGDAYFVWTTARLLAERRATLPPVLELRGIGRAAFALVANTDPYTYAARVSVHVAPRARFELGLDVVAAAAVNAWTLPRLLVSIVLGRGDKGGRDLLYGHDLDRIELLCDTPLPAQADGEYLGEVTEAFFEAERGAVRVFV